MKSALDTLCEKNNLVDLCRKGKKIKTNGKLKYKKNLVVFGKSFLLSMSMEKWSMSHQMFKTYKLYQNSVLRSSKFQTKLNPTYKRFLSRSSLAGKSGGTINSKQTKSKTSGLQTTNRAVIDHL